MIVSRHGGVGKRGFSLVEMSMVLAIIGAIGVVLWKFLPGFKSLPAIARLTASSLDNAEEALNGFILTNGRLPCPATALGGNEDCSASSAGEWLPTRTLGLNLSEPVRYGVYRNANTDVSMDADLAVLKDRYNPQLPDVVKSTFGGGQVPTNGQLFSASQSYAAGSVSPQSNGLDFCAAVRNLARAPGTVLTAGAQHVPIAYGLAVAGAGDADGDGSAFDGLNRVAGQFELSGAARRADFNDASRVVGANELFTRLGCATRFSAVNGAARAAYAAFDIDRHADLYQRFREFDIEGAQGNVDGANVGIVLASVGEAVSGAAALTAILETEESDGLTFAAAGLAVVALEAATLGLAEAIAAKVLADDALIVSQSKLAPAIAFKALTAADFAAATQRVQTLDSKGLLP